MPPAARARSIAAFKSRDGRGGRHRNLPIAVTGRDGARACRGAPNYFHSISLCATCRLGRSAAPLRSSCPAAAASGVPRDPPAASAGSGALDRSLSFTNACAHAATWRSHTRPWGNAPRVVERLKIRRPQSAGLEHALAAKYSPGRQRSIRVRMPQLGEPGDRERILAGLHRPRPSRQHLDARLVRSRVRGNRRSSSAARSALSRRRGRRRDCSRRRFCRRDSGARARRCPPARPAVEPRLDRRHAGLTARLHFGLEVCDAIVRPAKWWPRAWCRAGSLI